MLAWLSGVRIVKNFEDFSDCSKLGDEVQTVDR